MKTEKDWLVGQWQTSEEDSDVILEISKAATGFNVRAFDKEDKGRWRMCAGSSRGAGR